MVITHELLADYLQQVSSTFVEKIKQHEITEEEIEAQVYSDLATSLQPEVNESYFVFTNIGEITYLDISHIEDNLTNNGAIIEKASIYDEETQLFINILLLGKSEE